MFASIARGVLVASGLAALASPTAAAPVPRATPFSPVAAGIDKVCSPVARGTAAKPAVHLYRPDDADGNPSNWYRSDPKSEARAVESPDFHGGDFVIVNVATALVTVSLTHREAAMDQATTKTSAWCFEGGKLSRATFDLVLPEQKLAYRRTQYFDSDLDVPAFDEYTYSTIGILKSAPTPAPDQLPIEHYHTPSDLPFYYAYEAALDGKLPPIPLK